MAYLNVKITDLTQVQDLRNDDLLLVSHPLLNSEGALQETPYTSNSISGGALSGTIKEALRNDNVQIEGDWHFHTDQDNLPTQDFKLDVSRFVEALNNVNELNGLVNDGSGWYYDLSTSFVQKEGRSGESQSLSVMNNVIPNIDFVQRVVAAAYQLLFTPMSNIANSGFIPSHIGQIIHSTTLSSKAMVQAIYGNGRTIGGIKTPLTNWKQHSGYFLRGASSNVLSNNNTSLSGTDNQSISISDTHNHSFSASHKHNIGGASVKVGFKSYETHGSGGTTYNIPGVTGSGSIASGQSTSSATASGTTGDKTIKITATFDNRPLFKNVYIWERIS